MEAQLKILNSGIVKCRKCHLAESRLHALPGEGDIKSKFFLVALSPGEQEDREGSMFIGPSGQVLDRLLKSANVERDSLYISNLIKCNLPQNRKPKLLEIEACHQYLDEELELIKPEFIIPLGFYASRYILEKYRADPPSAKVDFRPLYGKLIYAYGQKIFPLPHPASLLYNPDYYPQTQEKYNKLHTFIHPCKWYNYCPMKRFYQQGRLERKWIELYCHGDWQACRRYQMEENHQYHPDNMLADGSIAGTLA
ncbi:MAG: uracil-DNA glycosylase [Candidatus Cloacimonetes bacterium]|nr:uracil-DNA glycosylase [Candidatus Cloacimonadota bacterium]